MRTLFGLLLNRTAANQWGNLAMAGLLSFEGGIAFVLALVTA